MPSDYLWKIVDVCENLQHFVIHAVRDPQVAERLHMFLDRNKYKKLRSLDVRGIGGQLSAHVLPAELVRIIWG